MRAVSVSACISVVLMLLAPATTHAMIVTDGEWEGTTEGAGGSAGGYWTYSTVSGWADPGADWCWGMGEGWYGVITTTNATANWSWSAWVWTEAEVFAGGGDYAWSIAVANATVTRNGRPVQEFSVTAYTEGAREAYGDTNSDSGTSSFPMWGGFGTSHGTVALSSVDPEGSSQAYSHGCLLATASMWY